MYPNQNSNTTKNTASFSPSYPEQQYQQPIQLTPSKQNNTNLALIMIVVLAILAIGGIAFGTITFISNAQEIAKLNDTIVEQETALQNNTTLAKTDDNNTSSYIYIGEWGIKIKIPEELSWVGYDFTPSDKTSSIAVYGAKGQFDTRPEFLNVIDPGSGYGFITRAPLGYGSVGGLKVFSNGGYDYYYTILQKAITDNAEQAELESASKALVETMLTTVDNYSPI